MLVIDGSILVSPYFEVIVKDVEPSEIVVPRIFRKSVLRTGEVFPTFISFHQADEAAAWSTYTWAKSQIKDWVDIDDERFKELVDRAANLYPGLFEALQESNPDLGKPVGYLITDELFQAIVLSAPIIAIGGLQATTWSVIKRTFEEPGQCIVADLSPEEKRKRLQKLNLSLASILGLDLCSIEVIAPLPFARVYPQAAVSHCRFVAIDP